MKNEKDTKKGHEKHKSNNRKLEEIINVKTYLPSFEKITEKMSSGQYREYIDELGRQAFRLDFDDNLKITRITFYTYSGSELSSIDFYDVSLNYTRVFEGEKTKEVDENGNFIRFLKE